MTDAKRAGAFSARVIAMLGGQGFDTRELELIAHSLEYGYICGISDERWERKFAEFAARHLAGASSGT